MGLSKKYKAGPRNDGKLVYKRLGLWKMQPELVNGSYKPTSTTQGHHLLWNLILATANWWLNQWLNPGKLKKDPLKWECNPWKYRMSSSRNIAREDNNEACHRRFVSWGELASPFSDCIDAEANLIPWVTIHHVFPMFSAGKPVAIMSIICI